MSILPVLLSLPVFTQQFTGEGEIVARGCLEDDSGYFAMCTDRDFPGGLPESFGVCMDNNGITILSYTVGTGLETLQLCPFAGEKAVLAHRPVMNSTIVFQIDRADISTEFQDQFMEKAVMDPWGSEIIIAGNDSPDNQSVRIAVLDASLVPLSNQDYPGVNMLVADVSTVNGEICVLGSSVQRGWQRDIMLFFPGTLAEYHFQPLPGRFKPVALEPWEEGLIVVANSVTDQNGMVGEIFLLKLASDMSIDWTATLGGSSWLNAASADLTGEGIVVAGWTNDLSLSETNRSDLFVAEYSLEGQLLWTREYGGNTTDYALEIETCQDGGFLVTGCYGAEYYQGLLLRTDSLGTLEGLGLEEEEEEAPFVSVNCNPSRCNSIAVCIPDRRTGQMEVSVLDITGRRVRSAWSGGGNVTFTGLSAGVYLVMADTGSETAMVRAVVTGGDL